MTTRIQQTGQAQRSGGTPQSVEIISDERPSLTLNEQSAGLQWVDGRYLEGDLRRYGATPETNDSDTRTANSAAFQRAVSVCMNNSVDLRIDGGYFYFGDQLSITAGANTAGRMDITQSPNSRLVSYVTGSVSGYDTAGFGILIDGWRDSTWYGFSLDHSNGTAGVCSRCRNHNVINNNIYVQYLAGGTALSDRDTTTNINWRFIGNESGAGSTGYVCYYNTFFGGRVALANKCFDFVVGDGSAATQQPNAQKFIGIHLDRYWDAFDFEDTDEHLAVGCWASNSQTTSVGTASSVTQTGGTATFNLVAHGLQTDDLVVISGATPTDYNGLTRITRIDDDSFTYTKTNAVAIPGGTSSPATGTITATRHSVVFRGETTFSQLQVNNESGGVAYFIEDGGGAGNILQVIDNVGTARSIVEDATEINTILRQNAYSCSGKWRARIDDDVLAEGDETDFNFNVPVVLPSYTNSSRPAAGTAGLMIFNTDDGQLNIDDGTNWTLPDGTTT